MSPIPEEVPKTTVESVKAGSPEAAETYPSSNMTVHSEKLASEVECQNTSSLEGQSLEKVDPEILKVDSESTKVEVDNLPSSCEGKLGVALKSLQGLRDLTYIFLFSS